MDQPFKIKAAIKIYLPFKTHNTYSFRKKLYKDNSWDKNPCLDTRFYLKYIDRIFNKESVYSDCFVTEKHLDSLDFIYEDVPFSMSRARIFSFDTSVAFLEMTVTKETDDFSVLEDITHLLRQGDEKCLKKTDGTLASVNMVSEELLSYFGRITLFDHICRNAATRPELFVTVVTDSHLDTDIHSYRLSNGLNSHYKGDCVDCEFYSNYNYIRWAVTKRGVCNIALVTDDENNNKFVLDSWISNTDSRYIIWYILALHQKYALFQYLNDIAEKNSSRHLGDFQKKIMILNTKYRFSLVSEETSYQKVYEIICRVKNLNYEFEDADEEVERIFEYNEAKSNKNNVIAMTMISILCAFSAVKDLIDMMKDNKTSSLYDTIVSLPEDKLILFIIFVSILIISFAILLPRHKIASLYNKIKKKILKMFF